MQLGNFKTIEELFKSLDELKKHTFPNDDKYVTRYNYLSSVLDKWIHPTVVAGAMTVDGGFLNDHGPDHISKVILRASELIKNSGLILSEYELYILLMAIQLHDIGNLQGREHHELNSLGIIKKFGIHAGQDRIEWDTIFEIAEAHGGTPKDKISELDEEEMILSFSVRKQLLASILKFADELAEDRTRANRFMLANNMLPEHAIIYHKYSYALHSVKIDLAAKQINLSFDLEEEDLCKKFKKVVLINGDKTEKEVYLIDEIYERTYKTHLERTYCMRFTRPNIQIDKIRVDIQITTGKLDSRNKPIKNHILYDIGEVGYPNTDSSGMFSICPTLKDYVGEKICDSSTKKGLKNVTATY